MIRSMPKYFSYSFLLVGVEVLWFCKLKFLSAQEIFSNCNIDEYYAALDITDISSWTRQDVQNLLMTTHRKVLPYTGDDDSDDDVWKALIDLDQGIQDINGEPTVHLVYRDIDVPAIPYGTPDTWNREHLWPKSLGVGYTGADFTDIHHLRPADWNVNAARSNLYFGDCEYSSNYTDVSQDEIECRSPATSEASLETASNGFIFRPPISNRGDIARALFYMDVRYSGNNGNELDLILMDCPSIITSSNGDDEPLTNEMAFLSQLLEWHNADPVSDSERIRNEKACERWQGNRNIFVDYPELVNFFFGQPKQVTGFKDGLPVYESCNIVDEANNTTISAVPDQTAPPESLPPDYDDNTLATCDNLTAGDVLIVGVNSFDPDSVALVTLVNLKSGLDIYMTDNAWTGSSFRDSEGALRLKIIDNTAAGTVFGFESEAEDNNILHANSWEKVSGSFSLSTAGDNIIIYCLRGESNEERINFLSAISLNDEWLDPGLDEASYGSGSSSLPKELATSGSIALPHADNYQYTGPTFDTKIKIKIYWSDSVNWEASNSERFEQPPEFTVKYYESMAAQSVSAAPLPFKILSTTSFLMSLIYGFYILD